ncbi:MAG: endonuclease [Xanthomonadaceae bacterium]|nr:endonuclease [Xanthomonadaceae bacterium]
MVKLIKAIGVLLLLVSPTAFAKNTRIQKFEEAKKILWKIHAENSETLYCGCKYSGKLVDMKSCGYMPVRMAGRAAKIEWEHVVPAEAFGQSFKEWRTGSPICSKNGRKTRGRKCAEKASPEYTRMAADLYNLWPEIGELNALRSNFSMAELTSSYYTFGECKAKILDNKFEPMDKAKGIVARTYMYMEKEYPGRGVISDKNKKLFEAWDKMHPVTPWECKRAQKIEAIQGSGNSVLKERCSKLKG